MRKGSLNRENSNSNSNSGINLPRFENIVTDSNQVDM